MKKEGALSNPGKVVELIEGYKPDEIIMDELSYISISFDDLAKKIGIETLKGHVIYIDGYDGRNSCINVDECIKDNIYGTSMCVLNTFSVSCIENDVLSPVELEASLIE